MMQKELKVKLIKYIFLILLTITFLLIHEVTHIEINRKYGCRNTELIFYGNQSMIESRYICKEMDMAKESTFLLAHSINEVVGYTIMPLLLGIFGVLYLRGCEK